jgi:hypothetical protein
VTQKRKIRNYLLNKRLQLRITLKFVLLASLLSILSGIAVFLMMWPVIVDVLPPDLIDYLLKIAFIGLPLGVFAIALLITAISIKMTHRLAGPIYRVERALARWLEGAPIEPLKIRRKDEFHELIDLINRCFQDERMGAFQASDKTDLSPTLKSIDSIH